MKVKTIYIWLMLATALLTSCDYEAIRPSGEVTSREVSVSNYNSIEVSDAFEVHVFFSDTEEKITIEANSDLHNKVVVENVNNTLIIRLKNRLSIKGKSTLNAFVTTKNINNFDVSGAAKIVLYDELISENSKIELSGASDFFGEVNVNNMELRTVGASEINLFGNINNFKASLSGASELKDYDLITKNADINISGASDAWLSITESLKIEASGASVLKYKGDATILEQKVSGSAKILKKK